MNRCDRAAGTGALVELLGLFAGGNHGQFVSKVAHDAHMVLASVADFGIIAPSQIGGLQGCVESTLAKRP